MSDFKQREAVNAKLLDLYGGDPFGELIRVAEGHRMAHGPECGLFPAGRTPSEIAAVLFCSRSSVYRVVKAYRAGTLRFDAPTAAEASRVRVLTPTLQRSLLAILGTVPRACGWCRTRWSCTTLALELQIRRGAGVGRNDPPLAA